MRNFIKGFIDFYKFLFDTDILLIETYGRSVACAVLVAYFIYFLDFVGILTVGGK